MPTNDRERAAAVIADHLAMLNRSEMGPFDYADAALDALHRAGIEFAAGWQDIETAPKDGTHVFVGAWVDGEWDFHRDVWEPEPITFWGFPAANGELVYPTHWRPLPNPPLAGLRVVGEAEDGPVTEAWLREIGWSPVGNTWYPTLGGELKDCANVFWIRVDGSLRTGSNCVANATRRDVLALLAALRIPVKEKK